MSEELTQKGYEEHGTIIGDYEYYNIGATTLDQLKSSGAIPSRDYGRYSRRKPDGLLIKRGLNNIEVIAVIEWKIPQEFRTEKQRKEALQQCNDIAQTLNSKIGIITDGQVFIWINPKEETPQNKYFDRTTNTERSYSIIKNEDRQDLTEPFVIQTESEETYEKLEEETKNTLYYIERILTSVTSTNSIMQATQEIDPIGLARSVWQDIYINTGKTPVKCLYNVVELFIFKFLSDLEVLKSPYNFQFLVDMYVNGNSNKEVLDYYAKNSRKKIKELFRAGDDGTTIINGTIFVDSHGEPVFGQATLFRNSIEKYNRFGSLKNVKKEFKTKLFETFLKQSKDKSKLGQFFTPRKIVRAIVDMADVENLQEGARMCDPFCGVGGFILETIQKPRRKKDFLPVKNKIKPRITYIGYDKGSDEEDERTVILAKANMLIYLSDVVEKYPNLTDEFSEIFNQTFHLITNSNLGTLSIKIDEEANKYDLILTNPPYITGGITSMRREIRESGFDNYFISKGKGVDGLAIEWIVRSLKKNGKAFLIIRDGILVSQQNLNLRKFILEQCQLNAVISLPIKTFFNTPQKTYILGITKRENPISINNFNDIANQIQDFPVFTYLVSNIGETLDSNRWEIEGKSDLQQAKELFNSYKGSPNTFPINEIGDLRCKLQPISKFNPELWDLDNWWTKAEKIQIGIDETVVSVNVDEFKSLIEDFNGKMSKFKGIYEEITNPSTTIGNYRVADIPLLNLFEPHKGQGKYTRYYIRKNPGEFPVYSSQTEDEGIIGYINTADYDNECITWTTDGIYAGTVFHRHGKFSMTTHCGALMLKDEYKGKIDFSYVLHQLSISLRGYALSEGNKRVTVNRLEKVTIQIPLKTDGEFDIDKQRELAEVYVRLNSMKKSIISEFNKIIKLEIK